MRWRDIRFEKPTEKDGDNAGKILQMLIGGKVTTWDLQDTRACIAWMPTSELPQPNLPGPIPDGWRPVDKAVESKSDMMQTWDYAQSKWAAVNVCLPFLDSHYYIVPIEPPAPQYRPFASREEWWPHRDRWVRKIGKVSQSLWASYEAAEEEFNAGVCFLNDDGTDAEPFGVLVSTAESAK